MGFAARLGPEDGVDDAGDPLGVPSRDAVDDRVRYGPEGDKVALGADAMCRSRERRVDGLGGRFDVAASTRLLEPASIAGDRPRLLPLLEVDDGV